MRELQDTIIATPADMALFAMPIDLGRLMSVDTPLVLVRFELEVIGGAKLVTSSG